MDHERGALVEPFACVYQGVPAIGLADPGDLVCVVGAGTVGFCALAIVKALGAATQPYSIPWWRKSESSGVIRHRGRR